MSTAKVSLVITVLNEAKTIKPLMDSLLEQSLYPSEIIVIDAGSTDGTLEILKQYPITLQECDIGSNRSVGRNLGIKLAQNSIIAVTDAGCLADKRWLERLIQPFKDQVVLSVAGYYRPFTQTIFQTCVAPFVAVMPDKFNPKTYLPSSRSLAFRKGVAEYPTNLNYCEDLIFAQKLKLKGKMAVAPQAFVHWRQAPNLFQFFLQLFHYARGDVQARFWPHLIKITTVFGRYLVFLFFPWLFLLYLLWPIFKHSRYITNWLGIIYLPCLQLTADLAVMSGAISGIIIR